jgi:hypothetical protein
MAIELSNQLTWSKIPEIREWQTKSRLDPFTARIRSLKGTDVEPAAHLQRWQVRRTRGAQASAVARRRLSARACADPDQARRMGAS